MGLLLGGSSVLVEDLGIGTTDEVSNMRYRLKFGDDLWAKIRVIGESAVKFCGP